MASLLNLTVDMIGLSHNELILDSDVDGAGICVRNVLLIVYLFLLVYLRWCVFRL